MSLASFPVKNDRKNVVISARYRIYPWKLIYNWQSVSESAGLELLSWKYDLWGRGVWRGLKVVSFSLGTTLLIRGGRDIVNLLF